MFLHKIYVKINPKLFVDKKEYISAATAKDLSAIEEKFDYEASRISPLLGTFSDYDVNRIDYCLNLDLVKLNNPCTTEQQMTLFNRADIPFHYTKYGEYDKTKSHRFVSPKESCYLKSESVNINIYDRYAHLTKNGPGNPWLEDSRNIIRFEVQYKPRKLYPLKRLLKESTESTVNIIQELLSDEVCNDIISKYYNRVIMDGDYYTLELAKKLVKGRGFREHKERRLICALELVNQCRGIHKAKATLNGDDLEEFRHSLRELTCEGINPVTVPKSFNIKFVQNLLDAHLWGSRRYERVEKKVQF